MPWLLVFGFALGFGTTIAEPALIAVAGEAAEFAPDEAAKDHYPNRLRYTVAFTVDAVLLIGVMRILRG